MLPEESGTLPHRPWTPMSLVNGRSPQAKRCGRDGAKRKSVRKRLPLRWSRCGSIGKQLHSAKQCSIEKQLPPVTAQSTIGKQLHSAKQGTFGTSNLPNHQHRDAHPAEPAPSGSSSTAQSKVPSGGATCRTSSIGRSNLLNQQHREEHFLSNNGAKWAGAEGVRGSNLACFLKNFVSNYIVIFLMMLFRVHL